MAFTITSGDITVSCDTAREAADLIAMLRQQSSKPASTPPAMASKTEKNAGKSGGFVDFWKVLDERQRKLLRCVGEANGEGIVAERLAEQLGTDLPKLGWSRRKMNTKATDHGLDMDRLLTTGKISVDEKLKTSYMATPRLRRELRTVDVG
ncbi:MAG: hypothetical protein IID44_00345 [Planctomycetes bacterium]|nr:hypothetical protein [Planctomycetota bacterium]